MINYRLLVTDYSIYILRYLHVGTGGRDQKYSQINGLRTLKGSVRPDYIDLRVLRTIATAGVSVFKKLDFDLEY